MKNKHLFLNFSSSFKNIEQFKSELIFPLKRIPRSFMIEKGNLLIFGYFLSFEGQFTLETALDLVVQKKYHELVKFNADFLIFSYEEKQRTLSVVSDMASKFRLYFGFRKSEYFISTEFNLVKENLRKLTLNFDNAIERLTLEGSASFTTETVVNEIRMLPPCSLLTIKNGKWRVESLMDLNYFLHNNPKPLDDVKEFTNLFLEALKQSTYERLKAIYPESFASELSSGFDSTLIAHTVRNLAGKSFPTFTFTSPLIASDTNPDTVAKFALKHDLKPNFVPIEDLINFSKFDLNWGGKDFTLTEIKLSGLTE